jgi:hypothetical protein
MNLKLGNKAQSREFTDISAEESRQYSWPCGARVVITSPLQLNVSESGGHRILDSNGVSHYVPTGWIHLCWKVKAGAAHFVL